MIQGVPVVDRNRGSHRGDQERLVAPSSRFWPPNPGSPIASSGCDLSSHSLWCLSIEPGAGARPSSDS